MKIQTAAVQLMEPVDKVRAWLDQQCHCVVQEYQLDNAAQPGMWSFTAHLFPEQDLTEFLRALAEEFPS